MQEKPLLYDPLFETPPDTVIRDTPEHGFFGKAVVKKTVFILVLSLFVGVSIWMSFSSLTKDRFRFAETEEGWRLEEFNAGKTDAVLVIDRVCSEDGSVISDDPVSAVREYALCGNEYTSYILIGKDVKTVSNTAFYSCTSLQAVLVDPENPYYCSDAGVLYRQEDGKKVELILCPQKNYLYRAMLTLGEEPPADAEEAGALAKRCEALKEKSDKWMESRQGDKDPEERGSLTAAEVSALADALSYAVAPGVTRIGEMAFSENKALFSVTIPEGVVEFASMSFFKCSELRSLLLPDSAGTIGSDAFSYCAKLPEIYIPANVETIGHHAFFGCDGAEQVEMACAEENAPDCGQNWLPQRRKFFMKNVPVVYNAERRGD